MSRGYRLVTSPLLSCIYRKAFRIKKHPRERAFPFADGCFSLFQFRAGVQSPLYIVHQALHIRLVEGLKIRFPAFKLPEPINTCPKPLSGRFGLLVYI